MKNVLIGAILATLVSTPAFANKTRVYDVTQTVTKKVPQTEQICQTVEVPIYGNSSSDTGGAIVGGLIGGILGNQFGSGSGKEAATGVGAITGAIIGSGSGQKKIVGYRQENQCQNRTTYSYETNEVYSHSIVEFYYNGRLYKKKFQK